VSLEIIYEMEKKKLGIKTEEGTRKSGRREKKK
jgi:hypothetical protein